MGDHFPETHFFGLAGQIASKALGGVFVFVLERWGGLFSLLFR